ncbi:hypothetical protein, partial [Salmonella sp. s54836]|uniref:hypothetical protein n=1 Tax=Salmonella sp. s54836 TaxID=3159673 RepID=UPI00397EE2C7
FFGKLVMSLQSHSPGYAISSPNNSLWYHLKNINDQRISNSIRALYGDHFPIQIRDSLAEWIERQKWEELDPSMPGHLSEAQQLYTDMVLQLSRIKDAAMDFNEKA